VINFIAFKSSFFFVISIGKIYMGPHLAIWVFGSRQILEIVIRPW